MRWLCSLGFLAFCAVIAPAVARCETMSNALAAAYLSNPGLNSQRAATRAADEDVSRAESGYRPQVKSTGSFGYTYRNVQKSVDPSLRTGPTFPTDADLTITETLFNGNQTTNNVRRSESLVFGSRESLRATEQDTLQAAATAYMDVLRDTAVLELRRNNIALLQYQLRGARARFKVGEVTATDVAQVEASLATTRSAYYTAEGTLQTSIGNYRRIIGALPRRLEAARPIDGLGPASLRAAVSVALAEHPRIVAALQEADAAQLQIQVREAALYPTLDVTGRGRRSNQQGAPEDKLSEVSVLGRASVPIYSGGDTYASVREAKEQSLQARLRANLVRDEVRAAVESAWARLEASKALIASSKIAVKAAESALAGVREEQSFGQRTTYDVLLATQTLLDARVKLVSGQRDRIVASYATIAATGRLSATNLGLRVTPYDPTIHFAQVKDKWIGLRTPDGR